MYKKYCCVELGIYTCKYCQCLIGIKITWMNMRWRVNFYSKHHEPPWFTQCLWANTFSSTSPEMEEMAHSINCMYHPSHPHCNHYNTMEWKSQPNRSNKVLRKRLVLGRIIINYVIWCQLSSFLLFNIDRRTCECDLHRA